MRTLILTLSLGLLAFLVSCTEPASNSQSTDTPAEESVAKTAEQLILDKALAYQGAAKLDHADLEFVFRNRTYGYHRDGGNYRFTRAFEHEEKNYMDAMDNEGYSRFIDGELTPVPDSMAPRYASSINSVFYFGLLPYNLQDDAVKLKSLGTATVKGKSYDKIEVTFEQEGGGTDFDDVFVFWFDTETGAMDYLAYSYHTSGGGIRFREAINSRVVGGIRFQDYINYKADPEAYTPDQLDSLFEAGELEELSRVILEDVEVEGGIEN